MQVEVLAMGVSLDQPTQSCSASLAGSLPALHVIARLLARQIARMLLEQRCGVASTSGTWSARQ